MEIKKIGTRSVLFSEELPEWDLHIQLILGDKYNYLIDTGLGSKSVQPITDYLKKEGNGKPVIVINTHHHWDHIWGNHVFKSCTIISHKRCRKLIIAKWGYMLQKNREYVRGDVEQCLPNLVFEHEIYFPDDTIRIFYTPGHSADCISVLDERDRVLNAGDNIGDHMYEIVPELECDPEIYKNTLLKYKSLEYDHLISGHNQVLTPDIIDTIMEELETTSVSAEMGSEE